jgi:hypothetical protein
LPCPSRVTSPSDLQHTTSVPPLLTSSGGRFLRPGQVFAHPLVRIAADNQARADEGLPIAHEPVLTNLLLLDAEHGQDVLLALIALAQREEHDLPALAVPLPGGLLDGGEAGVNGREGGVAQGVGLLDVRRHELVGPGEVGQEGLQAVQRGCGQVQGLGAIGVGLEGADGVGDDG